MNGGEIRLSIIVPTYNRANTIGETLDSILMQESSYRYEIIIADDCSSDNSLQIAQDYQVKYPDIIKILPSQTNQKLFKNIVRVYADLKSDYFCVLDPDDFWTDKHKIQKALDFLESHKDYTCYFGNTAYLYEGDKSVSVKGQEESTYIGKKVGSRTITFEDFLKGKAFWGCTPASIFRNVLFKRGLPQKLKNASGSELVSYRADSFRGLAHLERGAFYYSAEVDSVYRVGDGLWVSLNEYQQTLIGATFYKDMWFYFDKQYLEMLVYSQREYQKYSPLKYLEELRERETALLVERIQQCEELERLYEENLSSINAKIYQKAKLKYKIFLWIYDKLRKKLSNKGLIVWGL